MTPEENRHRLQALRFTEQRDAKDGTRKSPTQPIHNSLEALWIKSMNTGGAGTRLPRRPRAEKVS